eukprot:5376106-Amphidinium_carterae.1
MEGTMCKRTSSKPWVRVNYGKVLQIWWKEFGWFSKFTRVEGCHKLQTALTFTMIPYPMHPLAHI